MKKYSHIIWDYNGTLLDDVWLCVKEMNKLLKIRNLPTLTKRSYRNVFDFPVEAYYRKIGFNFQKEPFSVVGTQFIIGYDKHKTEPSLHRGAVKTLQLINDAAVPQSVVSARDKDSLNFELKHHGIDHFFERIVGHHNHYADGKLLQTQHFLKAMNLTAADVLLVGDTAHDAAVADKLGCDCILMAHGHNTTARLQATGFVVVDGFSALRKLLRPVLQ